MRIVIIEDEELTAKDLAATIRRADEQADIVAILGSVHESVAFFRQNTEKLDLVFSDIQLGDGLSFEVFQQVRVNTPIIFCTAYDEYALNAFKVSSIHYMLKPFSIKTVSEALNKFKDLKSNLTQSSSQYNTILELLEKRKKPGSVLIYQGDKIVPVKVEDIAICYIENEITYLLTHDKQTHTINKTLEEMEHICGDDFFRANRQFLVSRKAISDTSQYFARKLSVNLHFPFDHKITVSKTKAAAFLDWLAE